MHILLRFVTDKCIRVTNWPGWLGTSEEHVGCPVRLFLFLTLGHAFLPSCVTAAGLLFHLPGNFFVLVLFFQ